MQHKDIGHMFKIISDGVHAHIDSNLKEHDLTCTQLRLLGYLEHNSGKATQKQVEDFLEVSRPTVVGIINRLEKNGYVNTYIDENNNRSKVIVVGQKAHALSQQMSNQRDEAENILIKGLSEKEVAELKRFLDIVYTNIRNSN